MCDLFPETLKSPHSITPQQTEGYLSWPFRDGARLHLDYGTSGISAAINRGYFAPI
jgi:hypothetical protein